MTQRLFFGAPGGGEFFALDPIYGDDDGTFVPFVATTELFTPAGWLDEATHRTATVVVNSNAGVPCRLTPILDGTALDGTGGTSDCRVAFTIDTPTDAGRRRVTKVVVGLFQRIVVAGTERGRVALRGTYVQFLLETTGAPTLPTGEQSIDVRFDGIELDYSPKGNRQPTVGPSS